MRFDDRLATVLAQPVAASHDRNVRWRQLVDLVARSHGRADRALLDRALALIEEDRSSISEPLRAAAARAIAGSPVPVALLEVFVSDTLAVAAPLLAGARLEGEALDRIRDAASKEVRGFLETLHPEQPKPGKHEEDQAPSRPARPRREASATTPKDTSDRDLQPSISDVLARLDRLRSERESRPAVAAPDEHPESSSIFRWECSASGEIDWVEGVPRGPLIGRSIAVADLDEGVDDCVERSFSVRAPFRDCMLDLGEDGQLAGQWTISGAPAFAPNDGRFIGYRGIAQRGQPGELAVPAAEMPAATDSHDTLREMIHEIKTPLNAIIGFAEIIDGQYFGPAHRSYRERAAQIVTNARALLDAANDLDFVARMQAAGAAQGEGTDFESFFPVFSDQLLAKAAKQGVLIDFDAPDRGGRCSLDPSLTERLLGRFTDAVLGASAPGEHLVLHVHRSEDRCALSMTRPRSTILAAREDLLDPEFTIGDADRALLGLGFSLRLVNGLTELAGGALEVDDKYFTIFVPMKH